MDQVLVAIISGVATILAAAMTSAATLYAASRGSQDGNRTLGRAGKFTLVGGGALTLALGGSGAFFGVKSGLFTPGRSVDPPPQQVVEAPAQTGASLGEAGSTSAGQGDRGLAAEAADHGPAVGVLEVPGKAVERGTQPAVATAGVKPGADTPTTLRDRLRVEVVEPLVSGAAYETRFVSARWVDVADFDGMRYGTLVSARPQERPEILNVPGPVIDVFKPSALVREHILPSCDRLARRLGISLEPRETASFVARSPPGLHTRA